MSRTSMAVAITTIAILTSPVISLAQSGEGLGLVIGEAKARALAEEAGFSRFDKLPVKNPFHQIFLLRA